MTRELQAQQRLLSVSWDGMDGQRCSFLRNGPTKGGGIERRSGGRWRRGATGGSNQDGMNSSSVCAWMRAQEAASWVRCSGLVESWYSRRIASLENPDSLAGPISSAQQTSNGPCGPAAANQARFRRPVPCLISYSGLAGPCQWLLQDLLPVVLHDNFCTAGSTRSPPFSAPT